MSSSKTTNPSILWTMALKKAVIDNKTSNKRGCKIRMSTTNPNDGNNNNSIEANCIMYTQNINVSSKATTLSDNGNAIYYFTVCTKNTGLIVNCARERKTTTGDNQTISRSRSFTHSAVRSVLLCLTQINCIKIICTICFKWLLMYYSILDTFENPWSGLKRKRKWENKFPTQILFMHTHTHTPK